VFWNILENYAQSPLCVREPKSYTVFICVVELCG
jgi:hypothetical protein